MWLVFVFFIINFSISFATPELSFWSGNKCSKCHINPQGGGIRTEFGWKFLRDASQFPIGKDEIKKIYALFDKENYWNNLSFSEKSKTNTELNNFAFGFDIRLQSFRSHRTELAKRKFFPMESALYLLFKPTNWISFNGQYNIGRIVFQGQDNWMVSTNLNFGEYIPEIQVGKFQPSFGIRDCDMTRFDRRVASVDYTTSLFPPDYSELGVELSFRKFEWLDFYVGVFDSRFLSSVTILGDIPIVLKHNPSFNTKIVFYPSVLNDYINYFIIGSSALSNGKFFYSSSFLGFTLLETFALYCEYVFSSLKDLRKTNNYTLKLLWFLSRGVIPFLTFENGENNIRITNENNWQLKNQSAVFGVKYFPIPYVELVVEYRYFKSLESKSTRWAFQIHFYY